MRFDGFEHLLSHFAETSPDAPALRYETETLGFAALYARVQARAKELKAEGKSCLGLLCDGSLDNVIEIFAGNLAGLQLVLLDASLDAEVLKTLIRYTDVDTLWGDEELKEELELSLMAGVKDGKGKILFFTSGTTERSKAVVLTDRSLCQSAWNGSAKLPLTPEDTLLCLLPLGHVFGFVCGLLWGLSCGACVALGRGARHYADDCSFYRPTAVSVVPMLLGFLVKMRCVNPELGLVLVGAGDCSPALLEAAGAMGLRVCFGYGLTETSSGVAISVKGDPFAMEVCPYKRPDATHEVLRDGVFYTGDLGSFDEDGLLHITGRKKDMLVLPDGTKIFLPEYESSLMHLLGHTELAVTLLNGRPALVFCGEGEEKAIREKMSALTRSLPRGQQIAEIIVTDEPLPRTATGKIKRWELQQKVSTKP